MLLNGGDGDEHRMLDELGFTFERSVDDVVYIERQERQVGIGATEGPVVWAEGRRELDMALDEVVVRAADAGPGWKLENAQRDVLGRVCGCSLVVVVDGVDDQRLGGDDHDVRRGYQATAPPQLVVELLLAET